MSEKSIKNEICGDEVEEKILCKATVQKNGIIRNFNGRIIARLVKEIKYDSEHLE